MEKAIYDYKRDSSQPPLEESDDWDGVTPTSECPVCKGAGFVHPVQNGKVDYSRILPCRGPGCLRDIVATDLHNQVTTHFTEERDITTNAAMTFSSFLSIPGTEKAYRYTKEIAEGISSFVWLLLYGGNGNGKTHLCHAIARTLLENHREVKLVAMADMLSDLKAAMNTNTTETLIRELKEVFFLIIDEWGLEYGSEWEQAKFDEIMTARFGNARPTVVATNLDISQLSPRLRSRFQDRILSRCVKNTAPDFRETRR